jgi:hypothetical protein
MLLLLLFSGKNMGVNCVVLGIATIIVDDWLLMHLL